jgi:pimeloyl-ACP methyl ester carboxylesterase
VLGRIDQHTWDFTLRADFAITPNLTIQYYGSPFVGTGRYTDFKQATDTLAQRYHVLAFDLPGFGRSDKQNVLYSPVNYAAFVKWLVEERVNGPFTLAGHSMGGVIALRFAAIYPRTFGTSVTFISGSMSTSRPLTLGPQVEPKYPCHLWRCP